MSAEVGREPPAEVKGDLGAEVGVNGLPKLGVSRCRS